MHTGTGQLLPAAEVEKLKPDEREKYVEVKRDLTAKEQAEAQIRLYAPCVCGSGKKFKFCCHKKS